MKNFKPDKKLRRKRQYKDYKKKNNILTQWQREQENRRDAGLPLRRMPVEFPERKKYASKNKNRD